MTVPSTHEPSHSADEILLTDVVFFEEGSLSDASVEPLLREMGDAWRRGDRPLVEEILSRHAQLAENPDAVLRLICEEICLREEAGAEVSAEDYLQRFPKWKAEVQSLLDCRRLIQAKTDAEVRLEQTPTLSDFNLLASLGEGAQGQVYLATQPALADRPVVIKITRCHGEEHRALARLQHTHIVPLYWATDDAAKDRRILCMPYFGNVTLGDLFKALKDKPPGARSGRDILDTLERGRASAAIQLPLTGPARQFLARASYVEAVCWMGACLADALHYAHERGLLHLDIKPSNVLLAADGQPMLLDFHLARGPIRPDGAPPRGMGGTPYFMSPEQQLAMESVCGGRPVTVIVDGRSDVYSLGLVLYQALSGQVPMQSPPPRLELCNPQVSVGLADIIQKCLARDPRGRYRDPAALASDLRRHLAHLPLKGVPNGSWSERWRKWRKRKPHGLVIPLLVLLLLATSLIAGGYYVTESRRQLDESQHRLDRIQELIGQRKYVDAVDKLEEWQATGGGPYERDQAERFREMQRAAKHGRAVATLHELVDRLRLLPGSADYSPEALLALEKQCKKVWAVRERLLTDLQANAPAEGLREQIYTDLIDLAVIWTQLRVSLARGSAERTLACREALKTLDEVEKLTGLGPNPVLLSERQSYLRALGKVDEAARVLSERGATNMAPRKGWEFYALGRSYLQRGEFTKAREYLDKAVRQEPYGFWPYFYQGICAFRENRYDDAVAAFRASIAASKEMPKELTARCYFNLAVAEDKRGRTGDAFDDYNEALNLNSSLAVAALNRGILQCDRARYKEAEADLKCTLEQGNGSLLARHRVTAHYYLAKVYFDTGRLRAAKEQAENALSHDSQHFESRLLLSLIEKKTRR
jgi:serine/threonine protein kinase/tetratricopeptide (TPR) repeat protein